MLYPKIEDCVARAGCKYTLAVIIAKRAKDLIVKMPSEVAKGRTKELTFALNEVFDNKLIPNVGVQ